MTNTPDILKKIIARKEEEIAECKNNISVKKMLEDAYKNRDTRDFYQALKDKADLKQNAIIAEIKKASPSKGVMRERSIMNSLRSTGSEVAARTSVKY
jgi:indole-3-glycerol phosphate synthase